MTSDLSDDQLIDKISKGQFIHHLCDLAQKRKIGEASTAYNQLTSLHRQEKIDLFELLTEHKLQNIDLCYVYSIAALYSSFISKLAPTLDQLLRVSEPLCNTFEELPELMPLRQAIANWCSDSKERSETFIEYLESNPELKPRYLYYALCAGINYHREKFIPILIKHLSGEKTDETAIAFRVIEQNPLIEAAWWEEFLPILLKIITTRSSDGSKSDALSCGIAHIPHAPDQEKKGKLKRLSSLLYPIWSRGSAGEYQLHYSVTQLNI